MTEILAGVIIAIGLIFDTLGCVGLVRMPDVYCRLQAATKCVTLGTCMILFGTFLCFGFTEQGLKALVCMVFIAITSPTAAHALAKGAYKSGVRMSEPNVVDRYAEVTSEQGS